MSPTALLVYTYADSAGFEDERGGWQVEAEGEKRRDIEAPGQKKLREKAVDDAQRAAMRAR
ncbi:MAG: hypothetical protein HN742_26800 [Lentisphaerae bacterium]|nr:hypothetical protein [Lentisphaerota bacterium]